jgi:disulfide oxidoreductase YuzD
MVTQRKFKIQINEDSFYSSYLDIMNGILKLTKKEKDILSWFMEREYYYNTNLINENVFSKNNRKLAEAHLEVSPHYLNNYIKSLKDKNMITKTDKGLEINSQLYVDKNDGIRIQFEVQPVG